MHPIVPELAQIFSSQKADSAEWLIFLIRYVARKHQNCKIVWDTSCALHPPGQHCWYNCWAIVLRRKPRPCSQQEAPSVILNTNSNVDRTWRHRRHVVSEETIVCGVLENSTALPNPKILNLTISSKLIGTVHIRIQIWKNKWVNNLLAVEALV